MKIKCEVLAVETNGDSLVIKAQGTVAGSADWRMMSSIRFDVPDTKKNQRTFHVGRTFRIEITP